MRKSYRHKIRIAIAALMIPIMSIVPLRAMGEVAPIEDTREQIENISQEQMAVLEELFVITKEVEALEQEEAKLREEIKDITTRITDLEDDIDATQREYDSKRDRMKQVLVYYQRGGPATYLEILLNAESFSEFLKSLNAIKDISHNVSELLDSLDASKAKLQEEKQQLDEQAVLLKDKEYELGEKLKEREAAKQKRETYLSGLEENRIYYEEQLKNLQLLWEDCKKVFKNTVSETTRIIGEGYFTSEDLNLGLGLFTMPGAIKEDTFNQVLNDNSEMIETYFYFKEGEVVLEVPKLHLVLHGNFVISNDSAIRYEVSSGTFYELSLDGLSIQTLFEQGPLIIDFAAITGDTEIVDFILQEVKSEEGQLAFVIKLKW
ncbi:MAG: hypothetical protein H6Q59_2909 [Firmicutes bacterium]|nr:hypothetical protein [Bacillota bacterium]